MSAASRRSCAPPACGRGDVVSVMAPNRPGNAGRALRRADARRGAQHDQHAPRRRDRSATSSIIPRAGCSSSIRRALGDGARGGAPCFGARLVAIGDGGEVSGDDELGRRSWPRRRPSRSTRPPSRTNGSRICLNYTSGTTGRPKGRRLPSPRRLSERARQRAGARPHRATRSICGPCRCSTATAGATPGRSPRPAGTHVCLDRADPGAHLRRDRAHGVTHFCCAPVVLYMLLNHPGRPQALSRDASRSRPAARRRQRSDRASWRRSASTSCISMG